MFEALLGIVEKPDLLPADEVVNMGHGSVPPSISFQVIDVDTRRTYSQPLVDEE
ncbi:TPA: hypothetical protein ACGJ7A_005755 [Pseudomonas aeruginosa]